MTSIGEYVVAFGLTVLIELPVYGLLLGLAGVRARSAYGWGLAVNVITHPALWFVIHAYGGDYVAAFVVGEIAVCLVEGGVLAVALRRTKVGWGVFVLVGVCANGLSAAAGLLLGLLA